MKKSMNVLLVGSGSREHALAEALAGSPSTRLFSATAHANPGIKKLSEKTLLTKPEDAGAIANFAKENNAAFAVFGPEAPLAAGVADALAQAGVASFGPPKQLAQLEASKSFCRELMARHGIPGLPEFRVFKNEDGLGDYVASLGECVVKADGLMGGKGVKVWGEHINNLSEAISYAKQILASGSKVVVEEKLEGEEFSLQSIVDGRTVRDCPPCQDHKRAFEGDAGPQTGGMGSYSCEDHSLPFLQESDLRDAHEITEAVLRALHANTGLDFKGVLYGGFMATAGGVRLLEYNVRFGDPEAMNVLPVMENDFAQVCEAVVHQRLHEIELRFAPLATVCKYLVPQGYPTAPLKGEEILVNEPAVSSAGARIYFGSVDERGGKIFTTSSRSIAVLGVGNNLPEAEGKAQSAVSAIAGRLFYRRDIGTRGLVQKRIDHMRLLRSIA